MNQQPTHAWDDEDNKPVIPRIPHPRTPQATEPSDLAVAVDLGRRALGSDNPGAVREALRILLRALDAEPNALNGTPGGDQPRCPAAHPEDPTSCAGRIAVTILDAHNAGANGCEHHGARLLASLDGGRVYPLPDAPEGAAIRVFKAAAVTAPYAWVKRGGCR